MTDIYLHIVARMADYMENHNSNISYQAKSDVYGESIPVQSHFAVKSLAAQSVVLTV